MGAEGAVSVEDAVRGEDSVSDGGAVGAESERSFFCIRSDSVIRCLLLLEKNHQIERINMVNSKVMQQYSHIHEETWRPGLDG